MNVKRWLMVLGLASGGLLASAATAGSLYVEDFNVLPIGWWINLPAEGDTGSVNSSGNGNPDGTPCLHLARGTQPGTLEMLVSNLWIDPANSSTWIPVHDTGFNWSYQAQVTRGPDSAAYPDLVVYFAYADGTYGVYELTPGPYRPDNGVWTTLSGTINATKEIAAFYSLQFGGEAMRANDVMNIDNIILDPLPNPNVIGQVNLVGYRGDPQNVLVQVDLWQDGTSVRTDRVALDADGKFQLDDVTRGTYRVTVKGACWLEAAKESVNVAARPTALGTFDLVGADINGDDRVSFEDFSILQNNYGQSGASANPLAAAAASGGCGSLGIVLLACLGFAGYHLGWRKDD